MEKINLKDANIDELNYYINTFTRRDKLKNMLGGCPPEELRVKANCFYCDECWISSLEKLRDEKFNQLIEK